MRSCWRNGGASDYQSEGSRFESWARYNTNFLQKKGDFIGLRKLIHKHKTENWQVFLKNLLELRIKNNVKEYFLRFYTV